MLAPTNDRTDLVDADNVSKDLAGEVAGVNKPLLILATVEQSIYMIKHMLSLCCLL